MTCEVGNEEYLSFAVFTKAVDHLEMLHPFDDGILMALFGHVHLPGHAVTEQCGTYDGELLEGRVPYREHLNLMVIHLYACVEKLHHK